MAQLDGGRGDSLVAAGHLHLHQLIGLRHGGHFVRDNRIQVFVVDDFFVVGNTQKPRVDLFKFIFVAANVWPSSPRR